jgi:exonuclease VII small subunit
VPRGKKKTDKVTALPDIKVGDRVVIVADGPKKGQHDAVVEIDSEDGDVRLAGFGWHKRADVEVLDAPIESPPAHQAPPSRRKAKAGAPDAAARLADEVEKRGEFDATVDGKDARIVLDGTTGGVAGDEPMIKPPLEDLVRSLARAQVDLAQALTEKKRAMEYYQDCQGTFNAVASEIVQHYGQVEQLGLNLQSPQNGKTITATVEGEEEDEDDKDLAPAGTGAVRSYPGREGPE